METLASSLELVLRLSLQDDPESLPSAEQALQAAIAVRDKLVTAYLDISRMAI